jgi:hypothetical protein
MSFLYSSLEGPFNMDTMILKYCYNFKLVFQNLKKWWFFTIVQLDDFCLKKNKKTLKMWICFENTIISFIVINTSYDHLGQ